MASTDKTTTMAVPTVPDDQVDDNEPPAASLPYTAEEDQESKQPITAGHDSSEDPTTPLIGPGERTSKRQGSIPIDLNNRETRLTLWAIVFFIFCIAEFSGNVIVAKATVFTKLKSAYQTWAASDFLLLTGAMLLFIECNPVYILDDINANENNMHKIVRYIICGLFVLGGFLRWIALGKHNDVMCNDGYCRSWHFAQDFMATWFSFVIAIDVLDLFQMINIDQRVLRMLVYTSLMLLCSLIAFGDVDHTRSSYNGSNDFCEICPWNAAETGWFFVFFTLILILVIAVLVWMNKYDGLLSNDKVRKYVHFGIAVLLNVGIGLIYYATVFAGLLFQTLLAIVAVLMITFDLMSLA